MQHYIKLLPQERHFFIHQLYFSLSLIFVLSSVLASTLPPVLNPCYPSPCGANSQCRPVNGEAICSCLPQFVGNPPKCHPECTENSDCPADRACINLKCANPCQNTCGIRAQCTVRNHNPICTCPAKYTGDPFIQCSAIRK